MPEPKPDSIEHAIQNLSQKRHVISDEALKAKVEYDKLRREPSATQRSAVSLEEELNPLEDLRRPPRLSRVPRRRSPSLMANFWISVVRGMGFGFGLLVLGVMIVTAYRYHLNLTQLITELLTRF